jgi:hypothetical protein
MANLKRNFDINPQDFGLNEWPTRQTRFVNPNLYGPETPFVPRATPPPKPLPIDNQINRAVFSFSELGEMSWDRLQPICSEWGLNESFLECKAHNRKDKLVGELRRFMRIQENREELER